MKIGKIFLLLAAMLTVQVAIVSCSVTRDFGIGDGTNCKVQASFSNGKAVYGLVCDSEVDIFGSEGLFNNKGDYISIDESARNDDVDAFSNSYFHGIRAEPVFSYDVDSNDDADFNDEAELFGPPASKFTDFTVFKERTPTFILDTTTSVVKDISEGAPPN